MKLRLHHVNVVSDNMTELHDFYEQVLNLKRLPLPPMIDHIGHESDNPEEAGDEDVEWKTNVAMYDVGEKDEAQIHAGRRQPYLGPRMGHAINPLLTGHYAFRTPDLDEVRRELTAHGIPFSDYGEWAVKGWDQIFLTDPAGNVIEIHQLLD